MDYKDLFFSIGSGALFCFFMVIYERVKTLEDKLSKIEDVLRNQKASGE